MNKYVKKILALSVSSALSFTLVNNASAATYRVIDRGEATALKYTYSQKENESGQVAISGTYTYNFPVQFEYLTDSDFLAIRNLAAAYHESIAKQIELGIVSDLDDLEDLEALQAGRPTANDLAWTIAYISSKASDPTYQKRGDTVALTNFNGTTEEFVIFDVPFEGTDTLTRSTVDIVTGITNSGVTYGSASSPYLPMDTFTDTSGIEYNYWVRDFSMRGFVSFNQGAEMYPVVPVESRFGGGISAVLDVNDAGVAVGFMSYKVNQTHIDAIESETGGCNDPEVLAEMPYEICLNQVQTTLNSTRYHIIALKSAVSSNGNVVTESLGLLATPHEDDERPRASYALGINSNGVAVGYADGWDDENVVTPTATQRSSASYAVLYKEGKVLDFNQEHYTFNSFTQLSKAFAINDSGMVVGHGYTTVNSKTTQKFFYVDTNVAVDEMELIYPTDFFSGSKSTARAINSSGFVVGEGEIETHNVSTANPRRTAAFLYDINNDSFTNVNDLISCGSAYNVIEARDINDEGVISASAVVKVDRLDAKGELMLDSDGVPIKEDVIRAVTLEPQIGEIEDCSLVEDKTERQGASLSFIGLFLLLSVLGVRRKYS
ncbi:MAG: DUF3466 family protein [Colwellia sp.]